jgi:hypothetical protein
MNKQTSTHRLRRVAWGQAGISIVFGLLVEVLLVAGYFQSEIRPVLLDVHYGFNVLSLCLACGVLLYGFVRTRRLSLLVGSLAVTSWLLGICFWTAYVYLVGEVITYPSVAEVGFQGFHLLMIPLGYRVLRESERQFYTPALAAVLVLPGTLVANHLVDPVSPPILLYGTAYLTLIGGTAVLAAHFLRFPEFRLLGVGLGVFVLAEMLYAGYVTPYIPTAQVLWLDPLWYGGLSVVALALVKHVCQTSRERTLA